eukprot:6188821-Pleurochrysis_carterae.AAC.1
MVRFTQMYACLQIVTIVSLRVCADHDYAFWWETFELLRRTTLVGWVLLIPHEKQFIRLITGLLVSQICLTVLLLVRPYKMHSDFQLASLSQVRILCCLRQPVNLVVCGRRAHVGTCLLAKHLKQPRAYDMVHL